MQNKGPNCYPKMNNPHTLLALYTEMMYDSKSEKTQKHNLIAMADAISQSIILQVFDFKNSSNGSE